MSEVKRYEERFDDQGDMEAFLIGIFNTPEEKVKKIDVRESRGGLKVIVKTVEKVKEETNDEVLPG